MKADALLLEDHVAVRRLFWRMTTNIREKNAWPWNEMKRDNYELAPTPSVPIPVVISDGPTDDPSVSGVMMKTIDLREPKERASKRRKVAKARADELEVD